MCALVGSGVGAPLVCSLVGSCIELAVVFASVESVAGVVLRERRTPGVSTMSGKTGFL